jgi:hypothetical protein
MNSNYFSFVNFQFENAVNNTKSHLEANNYKDNFEEGNSPNRKNCLIEYQADFSFMKKENKKNSSKMLDKKVKRSFNSKTMNYSLNKDKHKFLTFVTGKLHNSNSISEKSKFFQKFFSGIIPSSLHMKLLENVKKKCNKEINCEVSLLKNFGRNLVKEISTNMKIQNEIESCLCENHKYSKHSSHKENFSGTSRNYIYEKDESYVNFNKSIKQSEDIYLKKSSNILNENNSYQIGQSNYFII